MKSEQIRLRKIANGERFCQSRYDILHSIHSCFFFFFFFFFWGFGFLVFWGRVLITDSTNNFKRNLDSGTRRYNILLPLSKNGIVLMQTVNIQPIMSLYFKDSSVQKVFVDGAWRGGNALCYHQPVGGWRLLD